MSVQKLQAINIIVNTIGNQIQNNFIPLCKRTRFKVTFLWNFTTLKDLQIEKPLKHSSVDLTLATHKIIISLRALKRT